MGKRHLTAQPGRHGAVGRVQSLPPSEVLAWYRRRSTALVLKYAAPSSATTLHCFSSADFRLMWEFSIFSVRPGQAGRHPCRQPTLDNSEPSSWLCQRDCQPACKHRDYHSWNLMTTTPSPSSIFKTPCWHAAIRPGFAFKRSDHRQRHSARSRIDLSTITRTAGPKRKTAHRRR